MNNISLKKHFAKGTVPPGTKPQSAILLDVITQNLGHGDHTEDTAYPNNENFHLFMTTKLLLLLDTTTTPHEQ